MKCVNRSGILVPWKTVLSIPMTRRKQEQRTCHSRLVWNLRLPKYPEFLFKNVWHRDPCLPTIHPKYDENYKKPIWTPTFIFWLLTGNDKGRRIIHYKGSYPYNPEVSFSNIPTRDVTFGKKLNYHDGHHCTLLSDWIINIWRSSWEATIKCNQRVSKLEMTLKIPGISGCKNVLTKMKYVKENRTIHRNVVFVFWRKDMFVFSSDIMFVPMFSSDIMFVPISQTNPFITDLHLFGRIFFSIIKVSLKDWNLIHSVSCWIYRAAVGCGNNLTVTVKIA